MGTQPTPPLTWEGWQEIEEELSGPPADTPARRATFERMRAAEDVFRRMVEREQPASAR